MEYVVLKKHLLPAQDKWYGAEGEEEIQLVPGDVIEDGYLEPDAMARLWSSKIVEPVDMKDEKARVTKKGRLNKKEK